jgi:hypothetical protein
MILFVVPTTPFMILFVGFDAGGVACVVDCWGVPKRLANMFILYSPFQFCSKINKYNYFVSTLYQDFLKRLVPINPIKFGVLTFH